MISAALRSRARSANSRATSVQTRACSAAEVLAHSRVLVGKRLGQNAFARRRLSACRTLEDRLDLRPAGRVHGPPRSRRGASCRRRAVVESRISAGHSARRMSEPEKYSASTVCNAVAFVEAEGAGQFLDRLRHAAGAFDPGGDQFALADGFGDHLLEGDVGGCVMALASARPERAVGIGSAFKDDVERQVVEQSARWWRHRAPRSARRRRPRTETDAAAGCRRRGWSAP